jgi:hypothetical protein
VVNSSQEQTFDYDWLDRLTSAATSVAGTGQYDHTYSYDAIGNITDFDGNSYTYDTQRPHAVATAHSNSYGYDGNGNQVTRTIGGTTYTQVFDYENRLTEIKQGSTTIAEFVYDAGGNHITGTVNSVTTVYIAGVFEYQGSAASRPYI